MCNSIRVTDDRLKSSKNLTALHLQGGGATSMGFEETEEIGPDGKPHIISEKTFNPNGGKMSKAQLQAQKQMEKEMKVSCMLRYSAA
jgi:hypothetical protein